MLVINSIANSEYIGLFMNIFISLLKIIIKTISFYIVTRDLNETLKPLTILFGDTQTLITVSAGSLQTAAYEPNKLAMEDYKAYV